MTRVLVVDDEPQILRALRINLHARAYDVVVAASGEQALSQAAASPPDVVVLDLGLPDMDGVDVIRRLRSWTAVPIIILSGRSHSATKVLALDAGADDYVTKPFNIDELLARLRSAIRRSAGGEESPIVRIGDHVVDLPAHRITTSPMGSPDRRRRTSADARRPTAHPDGVAAARATAAKPGQAPDPARPAGGDPGAESPWRIPIPAAVHDAAPPQAGARPDPPAVPAHRTWDGVPVPALMLGRLPIHRPGPRLPSRPPQLPARP